ncbi:MAG TPA: AzlC family ABC transporter permease [Candidatus Limnocylindrales bacterium]|nr:AzlC family ABC transporter permease [Candidatus Limnocylindrales bacterium]
MEDRSAGARWWVLLPAAPLAGAIGVFGLVFGAAANEQIEFAHAVAMSLLVFSGTLQFATLGLLAGGAGVLAIVVTAITLNLRHVVMGAVLRPHVEGSALRRALLAWFMLDESFGLAISSRRQASAVLLISGALFFVAWQAGTLLGLLGARLVAVEGLAAALFPILFIGLAAATTRGRGGMARAVLAAIFVLTLVQLLPDVHAFVPIAVALAVAMPGPRDR